MDTSNAEEGERPEINQRSIENTMKDKTQTRKYSALRWLRKSFVLDTPPNLESCPPTEHLQAN